MSLTKSVAVIFSSDDVDRFQAVHKYYSVMGLKPSAGAIVRFLMRAEYDRLVKDQKIVDELGLLTEK